MKVASALVNRMLEKNMFLFGAVDLKEGSVTEKIKELRAKEDATIRIAQKKYLFFPFKSRYLFSFSIIVSNFAYDVDEDNKENSCTVL